MSKKRKSQSSVKEQSANEHVNSLFAKIKVILKNLKDNKEAYVLICGACGLALTSFWNIACDIGFKGFADAFFMDIQYIQRNNRNILVSLLVALGFAVLISPVFYAILIVAKKTALKTFRYVLVLLVNLVIISLPLLLILMNKIFPVTHNIITVIIVPVVFVAIAAAVFLFLYIPLLVILVDDNRKSKEIPSAASTSTNDKKQPTDKFTTKFKTTVKSIGFLILALLFFILSIYWFGQEYAKSQKEYEFLVDSYSFDFSFDEEEIYDTIILSQTDEYYYLSICTLSTSNGSTVLTIYPYYHSIVNKSEVDNEVVIRKKFDSVKIVKGECTLLSQ